jgi:hypothetical protein
MKKGHFPYLFNSNNKLNYVGNLPDRKYFMPEGMKPTEKLEFDRWYEEYVRSGSQYNHRDELIKYCSLDVTILRKSCICFHQNFKEKFNINIFDNSLTIAAGCNKIFRSKFMTEDSIGIIPLNGYRLRDMQSAVALTWLYTEEVKRGTPIDHAGNGRERKIGKFKVDGYYRDVNSQLELVFEFLGCYWHSCPNCYPHLVDRSEDNLLFMSRRENTESRLRYLRTKVHEVIVIWECEFRRNLREDLELAEIASHDPYTKVPPLNPRDAFFGGRTGTIKKFHKAHEGEKIRYLDVCSLYPYINKYFKVPLGHPKIHLGDQARLIDIMTFEGLLKVKVLPPSNLFHPVLPIKMHSRLMFVLCYTCARDSIENCTHSAEERSFLGTFVVDELRLAVTKGYTILEIFEGWEYEVQVGVFSQYVNRFLKQKQEASGFPSWCDTEERKQEYIRLYMEKEGVELDYGQIQKNPGKRSSAKLCLNSFWGKFAENPATKSKVEIVTESQKFFELVMSPTVRIIKVIILNDQSLLVSHENIDDARENLNTINVSVAAYTTCGARLKLYSCLELLGQRVLYYDTDSVIFTQKEGEPDVETGDYLGDWTDELREYGPGAYISEFVSGGPKNYAFEVTVPTTHSKSYVVKAKGFTLNQRNLQVVNFNSMKQMVLQSENQLINRPRRVDRQIVELIDGYSP